MSKKKWYDIKQALKTDCPYYVIMGKRSNGKTYSTLKYAMERFLKDGKQAVYLRRWKDDITGQRGQKVFSDFYDSEVITKMSKGKYSGLKYFNRACYFCNYDNDGRAVYNDDDLFCYFMALNDVEHDKSTGGYAKVETIIFDEFIARQGYLTDEFTTFSNVLSTIIRGKTDVKIIMLGNTISKFCPYFKEMGLSHIEKMEQGTTDIYTYGESKLKVYVHLTEENTGNMESNFYFAFDNPKLNMITTGKWELPIYPHCTVSFNNKDVVYRYYIIFAEKLFECQVVSKDDNIFTFIFENKLKSEKDLSDSDLIYSLDTNEKFNYSCNILKPYNKLTERIAYFYKRDKIFYSDNEVGNYIQNYLKECGKRG